MKFAAFIFAALISATAAGTLKARNMGLRKPLEILYKSARKADIFTFPCRFIYLYKWVYSLKS